MMFLALLLGVAGPAADALSCQFQRFGKEQREFDQNGDFSPVIIRFTDPGGDFAKLDSVDYSVYDPGHLLEGMASQLELTPSKVSIIARVEPGDMLWFEASNPKAAEATPPQPRAGNAVWKGLIADRPGHSALTKSFIGWCYFERGVAAISNETLIPRIVKK